MTFGLRNNLIFCEVIEDCLGLSIDSLARGGEESVLSLAMVRVLGGEGIIMRELLRMKRLHEDEGHYVLGAYHKCLLLAMLPGHCKELFAPYEKAGVLLKFNGERYCVRTIDVGALCRMLLGTDDLGIARSALMKSLRETADLSRDSAVFRASLARSESGKGRGGSERSAGMESIVDFPESAEVEWRRRWELDPRVESELEARGFLYRRADVFPYWPEWLQPLA